MKSTRKLLTISIDYADRLEAVEALESLKKVLKSNGKYYDRIKFGTGIMEFSITKAEADEYEVRIIDGRPCLIFQSKLND